MAVQAAVKLSTILDAGILLVKTGNATVGVDKTFSPYGFVTNQPGVAKWVDLSGGISVGFPTFTMSVREPTKASRIYKVTVKVDVPTLEQTSPSTATGIQPQPTRAYSCQCVMEFLLPERSTAVERQALLSLVNSLFHATINASDDVPTDATGSPLNAAVKNLEPVF
jgi:hypothetical protein